MTIVMAQQGWQCPKCGNIISPNMMWCPFCSGEKKLTYTTTSTPYKVDTSSVCKIENSSEKPNNCEYAKNPSGDVWECGCFLDTYCEHQIYDRNPDGTINIVECGNEPKTEPQTETPTNSEKVQLKVQLTDEPQTERSRR